MKYHSRCEKCKDEGFIFYIDPEGYEAATECECQLILRVERYLKTSGVNYEEYSKKTLDTFKEHDESSKTMKEAAKAFLSDQEAKGIGFFGSPGTGKTHICIAICQELTKAKLIPHLYFSYRREIQKMKAEIFHEEEYGKLINRWTRCKILYIDDLFKFAADRNGKIQPQDLQIMFDIINSRYLSNMTTIFSSEYTVNEIKDIDEALGSRIYSMIHPYGIRCDGENRRFVNAR